jgi:hypothetical protein
MRATEELSGKCKCNKCAYYRTVYNKEPCEDCTYEPDGEGGAIGKPARQKWKYLRCVYKSWNS